MEKITAKQLGLLQSLWARRQREGLISGPAGQQYSGDDRQQRIAWARAHLGQAWLATFLDLSMSQAGYLLDILNAKPTRLDLKIRACFEERGIADPEAWFEAFQAKSQMWQFRELKLHQLNRWQKIHLVNVLVCRGDEGRMPKKRYGSYGGERKHWIEDNR